MSFNVKNLHSCVPLQPALYAIHKRLEDHLQLITRTSLPINAIKEFRTCCLDLTYFRIGNHSYQQEEKLLTESPLSAVVANVYMETLEDLEIRGQHLHDMDRRKQDLKEFLHHINHIHPQSTSSPWKKMNKTR